MQIARSKDSGVHSERLGIGLDELNCCVRNSTACSPLRFCEMLRGCVDPCSLNRESLEEPDENFPASATHVKHSLVSTKL